MKIDLNIFDLKMKINKKMITFYIRTFSAETREFYTNPNPLGESYNSVDLFVPRDTLIKAHSIGTVDFDIKIMASVSRHNKKCGLSPFYIYPKCSIVDTPLRLANGVSIVERDYEGAIKCVFDNIGENEYILKKGTPIVKICGPSLEDVKFKVKMESL